MSDDFDPLDDLGEESAQRELSERERSRLASIAVLHSYSDFRATEPVMVQMFNEPPRTLDEYLERECPAFVDMENHLLPLSKDQLKALAECPPQIGGPLTVEEYATLMKCKPPKVRT